VYIPKDAKAYAYYYLLLLVGTILISRVDNGLTASTGV